MADLFTISLMLAVMDAPTAAMDAGANGSLDKIINHEAAWGIHRQGGFMDLFGQVWLVGDESPLNRHY